MSLHSAMLLIGLIVTLMSVKSYGVPLDDNEQQPSLSLLQQQQQVIPELNKQGQSTQTQVVAETKNTVTDAGVTTVGSLLPNSHSQQTTISEAAAISKERETTQQHDFAAETDNNIIQTVDTSKGDLANNIQQSQPSSGEFTEFTPKQQDDRAGKLESLTVVQDSAIKPEELKVVQQQKNSKQFQNVAVEQKQAQQREDAKKPEKNEEENRVSQITLESQQQKETKQQDQTEAKDKRIHTPGLQEVNKEDKKLDTAKDAQKLQPQNVAKQQTKQEERKQQQELHKATEAPHSQFQEKQKQILQKQQPQRNIQQPEIIPASVADSIDNHQVTNKVGEKFETQITGVVTNVENTSNNSTRITSASADENNIKLPQNAKGTFAVDLNATDEGGKRADRQNEAKNNTAVNWLSKMSQAVWSMIDNVKQLKAQYVDKYITTKLNNSETERRRKVGTDL
jgi:hypothetical protein